MSVEQLSAGTEIQNYRLIERIGTFVWKCEDIRNGKAVAVKILTRQLPKEQAKRDEIFKYVRVGAALYHPFLVPIIDVVMAGDTLLLVMELIAARPLRKVVADAPKSGTEVFRLIYQLAEVLKFLHLREVVHGNVNGDSVMVSDDGHLRLAGLNLTNIIRRKEGSSSPAYQQKGNDARSVAYMSPEQIAGQPVDFRTDVFSLGVVMYHAATGTLPWPKGQPADIARAIVEGAGASPKAANPNIEKTVFEAISRYMAKDQYGRVKDARLVSEELARVAPDAPAFASQIMARVNTAAAGAAKLAAKQTVLLLADVDAPEGDAAGIAARMQQMVGEAVYLFEGQVIDPFGARLVAELPSIEKAIEAGRKAEFDLIAEELEGNELPVRLLIHAGDVTLAEGHATGEAVDRGFAALSGAPHRKLLISESVQKARTALRLRDAGARGGLKLYEIATERAAPPETVRTPSSPTELLETVPATPLPKSRPNWVIPAALATVIVIAIAAFVLLRSRAEPPPAVAAPQPEGLHEIVIEPFAADPAAADRAVAIRLAVVEILRSTPNVRLLEAATASSKTYGATLRSAPSPVLVPSIASKEAGSAIPLTDDAAGIQGYLNWLSRQSRAHPPATTPPVLNGFTVALASEKNGNVAVAEEAYRQALAVDPNFLPLQLAAMEFFSAQGKDGDALAAAQQALALDGRNYRAARVLARASLARRDVPAAIGAYAVVLESFPDDPEALVEIASRALSVGDAQKFSAARSRLARIMPREVMFHEPDLLIAAGRFDEGIQKYYDIETENAANASLALKIGKIAVLRRTFDIARLELGKLDTSDPKYGRPLLAAYLAAAEGDKASADQQLQIALTASRPGDGSWTSAAEIYAMFGETKRVLAALQTALDRREPTIRYVLSNPLFEYLASDPKMQELKALLLQRQAETKVALAKVRI